MNIEVLCSCGTISKNLFNNALEALRETGKKGRVVIVRDIQKISKYGVPATPALVIDGVVRVSGRMVSAEEIMTLLQSNYICAFNENLC